MREDLEFAAAQGTKYGTDCGLMFLEAFAIPRSADFCDGWFDTLSKAIERDKQSILDRGGSPAYVQAFVSALFAAILLVALHIAGQAYARGITAGWRPIRDSNCAPCGRRG